MEWFCSEMPMQESGDGIAVVKKRPFDFLIPLTASLLRTSELY